METRNVNVKIRKLEGRTFEFVISDQTKDRHGTVLDVLSWKLDSFNKSGIFAYQHRVIEEVDPNFILGPASARIEGNQLVGTGTFETAEINPLAEQIYKKVANGTLKSVSVGFIPGDQERVGDSIILKNNELLEFSIVNVGSNPNALKRSAETNRRKKNNILNYL